MEKYSHKNNIRNIRTITSAYAKLQDARNKYIDASEVIKGRWMYSDKYKAELLEDAREERDAVMKSEAAKMRDAAVALRNPTEIPALDGTDKDLLTALQMLDTMGPALDPEDAAGIVQQFRTDLPAEKAISAKLQRVASDIEDAEKRGAMMHQAKVAASYAEPLNVNTLDNIINVASSVIYNPDNFKAVDELGVYFVGERDIKRLTADAERIGLDLDTDPDLQTWESNREQLRQSDPLAPKLKAAQERLQASWRDEIQNCFISADTEHAGEYAKYADEQFAKRPAEGYAIYEEVHEMWRANNGFKSESASPSDKG